MLNELSARGRAPRIGVLDGPGRDEVFFLASQIALLWVTIRIVARFELALEVEDPGQREGDAGGKARSEPREPPHELLTVAAARNPNRVAASSAAGRPKAT